MFILYGIVAGLVLGRVLGGRLDRLAALRFRLAPLALAALAVQIALFSPLADGLSDGIARGIYVVSTAIVAVVVLANIRIPGVSLVVAGAASNLAAIIANGGAMPASPAALAALGMGVAGNTNSVVLDRPALEPLTDVFAMPEWLPFANVFSVGDVLIGIGVAVAIAAGMRDAAGATKADAVPPSDAAARMVDAGTAIRPAPGGTSDPPADRDLGTYN
jgi:hypothetical protein